ncbi:hypothetical protein [Hoeflea olei]|uniref:Uncharacterized protein n=1 Tax=Hoeflea olei TaxID=1480615 RepID=A0A1C1YRW0_9HYPH|nr:hypothetical protein [Hoeflea olei]OCW56282.1 hypothetical protein AWJ14_19500 [Hoeflea olei]
MYLCDFMTFDGQRFFISADLRTTRVRIEPVTNEAFETFIRAILAPIDADSISIVASESEVSA